MLQERARMVAARVVSLMKETRGSTEGQTGLGDKLECGGTGEVRGLRQCER